MLVFAQDYLTKRIEELRNFLSALGLNVLVIYSDEPSDLIVRALEGLLYYVPPLQALSSAVTVSGRKDWVAVEITPKDIRLCEAVVASLHFDMPYLSAVSIIRPRKLSHALGLQSGRELISEIVFTPEGQIKNVYVKVLRNKGRAKEVVKPDLIPAVSKILQEDELYKHLLSTILGIAKNIMQSRRLTCDYSH